ncbi:MAG: hypothetical protein QQN44_06810, partial [Nitrosopumilus sp.]
VENPLILCGHQHIQGVIQQNKKGIREIHSRVKLLTEKIGNFILEKREILIEPDSSYLVRVGLGGPEGYYGTGSATPHFGIIQYNPKKVVLFGII